MGSWQQVGDTKGGCEFSKSCFECPLPRCKYEMPPGDVARYRRWLFRDVPINAMLDESVSVADTAKAFGVTVRTVYRIKERVAQGVPLGLVL